jgi:NAD(P)-dependent dehydrogenase (short-subunit alcohol dehydrogenase family)
MRELKGKVAVVTGAASGIGRAMADAFAAEGMQVVLADVEAAALTRAAEEVAKATDALAVVTDVSNAEQVEALAKAAEERFGAVHVLCNNAGVCPIAPVLDTSLADWRWVIDVNLMGVVHGIASFGPRMQAQGEGHIVNTASSGGLMTVPNFGAYVASKHAVVGLTESLYQEWSGSGVGVSVLCPGLVATKIFESERNRPDDGGPTDYPDAEPSRAAIPHGAPPAEIAAHVVAAVKADRLHILPSPEVHPILAERFRCILEGENIPLLPSFDSMEKE